MRAARKLSGLIVSLNPFLRCAEQPRAKVTHPAPLMTGEEFYPIKPPSRPLSFDNPPPPLVDGEVSAASLEGLWVGTYGGHGLEFGYLSVKLTLMESSVEGQATWSRVVDFVKVTGDSNVPSGQVSWPSLLSLSSLLTHASPPDILDSGPPPTPPLPLLFPTHLSRAPPLHPLLHPPPLVHLRPRLLPHLLRAALGNGLSSRSR